MPDYKKIATSLLQIFWVIRHKSWTVPFLLALNFDRIGKGRLVDVTWTSNWQPYQGSAPVGITPINFQPESLVHLAILF